MTRDDKHNRRVRYVDASASRICFHTPDQEPGISQKGTLDRGCLDLAVAFVPPRHQGAFAIPRPGTGRPLRMCELVTVWPKLAVDAPPSLPCRDCRAISSSFVPLLPPCPARPALPSTISSSLPPSPRSVYGRHHSRSSLLLRRLDGQASSSRGGVWESSGGGSFGVAKEQATWDDEPECCGGPEIRVCHARGEGEALV